MLGRQVLFVKAVPDFVQSRKEAVAEILSPESGGNSGVAGTDRARKMDAWSCPTGRQ